MDARCTARSRQSRRQPVLGPQTRSANVLKKRAVDRGRRVKE